MLLLSLATLAHAGTAAIAVGGGYDLVTSQPWTGLDLALHPSQDHGFAAIGRVQSWYGFADRAPLGSLELGGTFVVPHDEAIIRAGLLFRGTVIYTEYPAAVRPFGPGAAGDPALGLLPGGMALVEFEWGTEAPFTLRLAGGTQSQAGATACDPSDVLDQCVSWGGGFIGGLSARYRTKGGLYAEAWAGPSPSLVVGYAFSTRKD